MEFSKHITLPIKHDGDVFKIQLPTNIKTDKLTLNISNDSRYKLYIKFNNKTYYTVNSLTDISYTIPLVFGYEFEIETELQLEKSYISNDNININISTYNEKLNLNYLSIENYKYLTTPSNVAVFNHIGYFTDKYVIRNGKLLIPNSVYPDYITEIQLIATNESNNRYRIVVDFSDDYSQTLVYSISPLSNFITTIINSNIKLNTLKYSSEMGSSSALSASILVIYK